MSEADANLPVRSFVAAVVEKHFFGALFLSFSHLFEAIRLRLFEIEQSKTHQSKQGESFCQASDFL